MIKEALVMTESAAPGLREFVLDPEQVRSQPWRKFSDEQGVSDKVLWRDPAGRSNAGIMALAPGGCLRPHLHPRGAHHLWVTEGSCRISGRTLTAGSYVHVPAGTMHGIDEAGPDGCILFFLFLEVPWELT